MTYIPAYDVIGRDDACYTALVLHGILGAGRNWRSFIRKLSGEHPDWQFVLVDHRWHGESGAAPAPHTVEACADDLRRLVESKRLQPDLVMGHSFGGKVALAFARDVWAPSLSQVIVLDATPGAFVEPQTSSNNEVLAIIEAIRGTTIPSDDRRAVKAELSAAGIPLPIVEWLATSLLRDENGWRWRYDLDAVEA